MKLSLDAQILQQQGQKALPAQLLILVQKGIQVQKSSGSGVDPLIEDHEIRGIGCGEQGEELVQLVLAVFRNFKRI